MIVVVVLAIVVIVVLAAMLVRANGQLTEATATSGSLEQSRDDAVQRLAGVEDQLDAVRRERDEALERVSRIRRDSSEVSRRLADATTERDTLAEQATALRAAADDAQAAIDAADARTEDLEGRLADVTARLATTESALAAAESARHEARQAFDDQAARLADAERAAAAAPARSASPSVETGPISGLADVLWSLEAARILRTWQTSVAVDPDGRSPFDESANAVRAAIEIEAAAVREDVGTQVDVVWEGAEELPAMAGVVVARVASEVMSAVAKAAEHATVTVVVAADHVVVSAEVADGDGEPVALDPGGVVAEVLADGYRVDFAD